MRFVFRAVSVPLVLAAAVAGAWFARAPRVDASLYSLIGKEVERIPSFLREVSASEVALVVSSTDAATARRVARRLSEKFPVADDLPTGALDFIRENRGGLVTPESAVLLRTPEGRAKIAKRAIRRLYSSPLPPVLGYGDDPFALTDAWLLSLTDARREKTAEGWPCLTTNGITRILLRHRLDPTVALDIERTMAEVAKMRAAGTDSANAKAGPSVSVCLAGAPVHAAVSARRCKAEIGRLTWLSLAVIAALALFVFRSLRWLPLLASSLLVAAFAGALALVVGFREIHVMTLVMGTTVLGLVIDYSFHWLLSPTGAKALVRKNLLVSFLTTEISLVPLMLSSIPVLRQSAIFLGSALAAALGYVLVCYPQGGGSAGNDRAPGERSVPPHLFSASFRIPRSVSLGLPVVLLALSFAGLFRVSIKTDVAALYRPSTELIAAEQQRAQFGGFDFSVLPSLEVRRKNAARVRTLYGEHGARLAETLGIRSLQAPPEPLERLLRPQTLMNEILGTWTRESLERLALSFLVLVAVVACAFRRKTLRILTPPVLALLAVAGALGWADAPINLFHILAAFLLLGMGVDYAVFLQSGDPAAFRPALCSLLTSVVGFGALFFVSFPVVRSFGAVLGVGLPVAFATAASLRGRDVAKSRGNEHGATPLGMEALFILYRLFGLRVLHFFAAGVGLCVWIFSPAVRRASPSRWKIRFFTRSLADKFVVLAGGRDLPRVETDGSPDAVQFVADVRSGKGVFVLSSHVGTIEVLTALGACDRMFHAWMDFDRTGVFNRFYLRHARRRKVVIHPISEFGMETVFSAGDWIDGGDCLVMAGDRGEGAFRFAAAFDHPVYFVACLAENDCRYRAVIRRLPSARREMKSAYEAFRQSLAAEYPDQAFDWDG